MQSDVVMSHDATAVLSDFGNRVRLARTDAGMSQEDLAAASGLHRTYVSSLERGQRNVSVANVVRLARALQVPPGSLLPE